MHFTKFFGLTRLTQVGVMKILIHVSMPVPIIHLPSIRSSFKGKCVLIHQRPKFHNSILRDFIYRTVYDNLHNSYLFETPSMPLVDEEVLSKRISMISFAGFGSSSQRALKYILPIENGKTGTTPPCIPCL